jgi:hypothetical protein
MRSTSCAFGTFAYQCPRSLAAKVDDPIGIGLVAGDRRFLESAAAFTVEGAVVNLEESLEAPSVKRFAGQVLRRAPGDSAT